MSKSFRKKNSKKSFNKEISKKTKKRSSCKILKKNKNESKFIKELRLKELELKELELKEKLNFNFFYILSSPENIKIDKYKIGILNKKFDMRKSQKINYKNARNSLKTRYRFSLELPKIFYFKLVLNNRLIKKKMLLKFDEQRTNLDTGNKSEWIKENFLILKEHAKKIIKKYGNNNDN